MSLEPLSYVIELSAQTSQKNSMVNTSDTHQSCHSRFYRPEWIVALAQKTHLIIDFLGVAEMHIIDKAQ